MFIEDGPLQRAIAVLTVAVPSPPGAGGVRVWHLMPRGWGPQTGRPRHRRVLMLPTLAEIWRRA
jgi:hypothetical protein